MLQEVYVYDIIEAYLIQKNNLLKKIEKEYENKLNDYSHINLEEKEKYIIEKLCKLPIDRLVKQIELNELLCDYDAVSLYPSATSAMWDEKSTYSRIETGYADTKDMNNELVDEFNNGNFTKGSAILRIRYYNPKNLIFQHLPVKKREKKIEIFRMRKGYNIDTLISVDTKKIVKIGGK